MNAEQLSALRRAIKLIDQGRGMVAILSDELRDEVPEGSEDDERLDEADDLEELESALVATLDQLEVLAR
jgi:hypothetical protein